jgi:hypothetical protein
MKQDWEYIADARTYLAVSMTDNKSRCVPDMDERMEAYFDLAWLQDKLIHAHGKCEHEAADRFRNSLLCLKPSIAFCHDCGAELCPEHIERKNSRTVCECCHATKIV